MITHRALDLWILKQFWEGGFLQFEIKKLTLKHEESFASRGFKVMGRLRIIYFTIT